MMKNYLSEREREVYNLGVRDAVKELWLYDGIIPDEKDRRNLCTKILNDVSYARPEQQPLKFQQP